MVLTPKGSDNIAQGNALGTARNDVQPEGLRQALSQAFSLEDNRHQPRALPWAMLSDPFGVKKVNRPMRAAASG